MGPAPANPPAPDATPPAAGAGEEADGKPAAPGAVPPAGLSSAEIAAACSLYDLGAIRHIRPLPRGSALSPKALLVTARGPLVLKRRAPARSREHDIGFSHAIQSRLHAHGFPLPKLICARDGRTFVRVDGGRAYEIFEFVRGHRFGADAPSARSAGETLARYHHLLASAMDHLEAIGYPMRQPTTGLYHNTPDFALRMGRVRRALADSAGDLPHEAALLCDRLEELYRHAADRAERLEVTDFPVQIIHGDWHPGNMVFQGARVAAVLDHDSAGVGQRIGDIANGALQFSLRAAGAPEMWPPEPDRARLRAFMAGLDAGPRGPVSEREVATIPWLMLQALVIEGVTPIATTGAFAGRPPLGPLLMIERKAAWLGKFAREVVSEIG